MLLHPVRWMKVTSAAEAVLRSARPWIRACAAVGWKPLARWRTMSCWEAMVRRVVVSSREERWCTVTPREVKWGLWAVERTATEMGRSRREGSGEVRRVSRTVPPLEDVRSGGDMGRDDLHVAGGAGDEDLRLGL